MGKKRRGATLVTVLIVAFFVSAMIYGMHLIFKNNDSSIVRDSESKELFYAVKSGLEIGEQALNANEKEYNLKDSDGHLVYDTAGMPVKVMKPEMIHDFEEGILTGSLQDTIDSSDLSDLSSDISVKIEIDIIDKTEADAYALEETSSGVDASDVVDRENMFRIKAVATNTKTGRTSEMTKIIDTNTLNTVYE